MTGGHLGKSCKQKRYIYRNRGYDKTQEQNKLCAKSRCLSHHRRALHFTIQYTKRTRILTATAIRNRETSLQSGNTYRNTPPTTSSIQASEKGRKLKDQEAQIPPP